MACNISLVFFNINIKKYNVSKLKEIDMKHFFQIYEMKLLLLFILGYIYLVIFWLKNFKMKGLTLEIK